MNTHKEIEIDGVRYLYVVDADNTMSLAPILGGSKSPSPDTPGPSNATPKRIASQGNGKRRRLSSNASRTPDEEEEDSDDDDDSDEDEDDAGGVNTQETGDAGGVNIPETGDQGKSNQKKKRTRTFWDPDEVEAFINILIEKHIVEKMDGKCGRLTHSSIFKNIAKALNEKKLGSKKGWKQCRLKYRKLKKSYTDCMKHNNISGRDREECDHFAKLNELFFKRPCITSSEWGHDSGPVSTDGVEDITEDSSTPPTPEPATTGRPAFPKQSPPRYRAGSKKTNTTHSLLRDVLEKAENNKKEFKEWSDRRMQQQEESDVRLMKNIGEIFAEGFRSIGQMFLMMQQPAAAAFANQNGTSTFPGMLNMMQAGGSNPMSAMFSAFASPVSVPSVPPQQSNKPSAESASSANTSQSNGISVTTSQSNHPNVQPPPPATSQSASGTVSRHQSPSSQLVPNQPTPVSQLSPSTNQSAGASSRPRPNLHAQIPVSNHPRPILRANQPSFVLVRGARPLQSTSATPASGNQIRAQRIIIQKQQNAPVTRTQ